MQKSKIKAFTIVELLVVITILAIISVVAYTNFSGSTDKAKNSKRLNDMASIETAIQAFFQEKNYYPMPSQWSATNVWGYSGTTAHINNTLTGTKTGDQFDTITGQGGGMVYNISGSTQIGAKGTIDKTVLSKNYLSQELLDPALKDVKVGTSQSFKDFGIGEYVYGVYAKNNTDWTPASTKGSAYNIAATLKDEQKGYLTKLIGNFDSSTCASCPVSLIGPGGSITNLNDGDSTQTGSSTNTGELMPYPIFNF